MLLFAIALSETIHTVIKQLNQERTGLFHRNLRTMISVLMVVFLRTIYLETRLFRSVLHDDILSYSVFHKRYDLTIFSFMFLSILSQSDGFAIRLFRGNIVNLTNNCFINNKFVGNGTVIAPVQNDIITSGNSGSNNGQLVCEFIYVENQNNCWNFESESCLNGSPPSASPPSPSSSFRRKISFPLVVATSALLSLFLFAAVS